MPAEIVRECCVGERRVLDIEADGHRYQAWICPAKGMNHEVVGYRAWLGPALPIAGDMTNAESAALRAIERIGDLVNPGAIWRGIQPAT